MSVLGNDTNNVPVVGPSWLLNAVDLEVGVEVFRQVRDWSAVNAIILSEFR